MDTPNINYEFLKKQGTGSHTGVDEVSFFDVPFDRYIVKVMLSSTGKFLGIVEVKVNKDFLSHAQKMAAYSSSDFTDIEKYYEDTDQD